MAEVIEGLFPEEKLELTEDVKELMDRILECRKSEREIKEDLDRAKRERIEAEEALYKTLENMGAKSKNQDCQPRASYLLAERLSAGYRGR